jgi:hypothetical protein
VTAKGEIVEETTGTELFGRETWEGNIRGKTTPQVNDTNITTIPRGLIMIRIGNSPSRQGNEGER